MDRLAALEIFLKIVDYQGFSAAAWQMNASPAKLSKILRALEQELGFPLLHRTTRYVELSEQGRIFYPIAKDIVTRFHASKGLSFQTFEPSGVIRIAAPGVIGNFFLFEPLHEFLAQYPKISVELLTQGGVSLVSTGEADLGFSSYIISDSKIFYHELFATARRLLASPKYLKRRGAPQKVGDLTEHDCLVNSFLHPEAIWQVGKQSVHVNARIKTTDSLQLIDAAIAGLGILWFPTFFVEPFIQTGQLEIIPLACAEEKIKIHLCYPALPKQDKARILVDFLLAYFAAHQLNSSKNALQ